MIGAFSFLHFGENALCCYANIKHTQDTSFSFINFTGLLDICGNILLHSQEPSMSYISACIEPDSPSCASICLS